MICLLFLRLLFNGPFSPASPTVVPVVVSPSVGLKPAAADTTRIIDAAFVERARLTLPAFMTTYNPVLMRQEPVAGMRQANSRDMLSIYAVGKDEFVFRQAGRQAYASSYAVRGSTFVVDQALKAGMTKVAFEQHFGRKVTDTVVVTDPDNAERYTFFFRKGVLQQLQYLAKSH